MPDRVDHELRRVSTALAEVSPPKPELKPSDGHGKGRSPLMVAIASFAVVLGVGLAASLISGGDPDGSPTVGSTTPTASTLPVVPTASVPEDHLVAELLDEGAGFEEFAEVSHHCSRGGSGAGPSATCLVDDRGMLVVVPLLMPPRVEAVVSGTAFSGEIRFELPAVLSEDSRPALEDLVGISHTGGSVEVEFWYNGEPSGAGLSSELPPSGPIPIPDGHAAHELLARDAGPEEIGELSVEMGFEFMCGGGQGVESCVVWEEGVAVVIPFDTFDGVIAEVSSPSYDGRWEIPFQVGVAVAVRHESGIFTLRHLPLDVERSTSLSSYFPASSAP